jgi:hypothetical protein
MTSSYRFERVDYPPEDAVTVRVFQLAGDTVAEVSWPPQAEHGRIISPAMGRPRPVRQALDEAGDAHRKHSLRRVVVMIEDESLWQSEWGTLFSLKLD